VVVSGSAALRSPGEDALGTVSALAGDIGPRGTGTPAEAAARDLVAGRLAALGLGDRAPPLAHHPHPGPSPISTRTAAGLPDPTSG
jgi:hypothetical protein